MATPENKEQADELTVEKWLAIRKEAGLTIDPEAAEVFWIYGQIADPYNVRPDLREECDCIGRIYFARSPNSDIWVEFNDLPDATQEALWQRHQRNLAFPAGLQFAPHGGGTEDQIPF
jgi:hypothetical protein